MQVMKVQLHLLPLLRVFCVLVRMHSFLFCIVKVIGRGQHTFVRIRRIVTEILPRLKTRTVSHQCTLKMYKIDVASPE